jgi:hypothetical protein
MMRIPNRSQTNPFIDFIQLKVFQWTSRGDIDNVIVPGLESLLAEQQNLPTTSDTLNRISMLNSSINGWTAVTQRVDDLYEQADRGMLSSTSATNLTTLTAVGFDVTDEEYNSLKSAFKTLNTTATDLAKTGTSSYQQILLNLIAQQPDPLNSQLRAIYSGIRPRKTSSAPLVAQALFKDFTSVSLVESNDGNVASQANIKALEAYNSISFVGGGSALTFAEIADNENSITKGMSTHFQTDNRIESDIVFNIFSVGPELITNAGYTHQGDDGTDDFSSNDNAITRSFTLSDPDEGDAFDIQVRTGTIYL